jgi:hypothetical protein
MPAIIISWGRNGRLSALFFSIAPAGSKARKTSSRLTTMTPVQRRSSPNMRMQSRFGIMSGKWL